MINGTSSTSMAAWYMLQAFNPRYLTRRLTRRAQVHQSPAVQALMVDEVRASRKNERAQLCRRSLN